MLKDIIKNILVVTITAGMLFSITGCGKKEEEKGASENKDNTNSIVDIENNENTNTVDLKNIYMEVLNETRPYVSEENKEQYLTDYEKSLNMGEFERSYVLLDMDEDSEEEMVILFSGNDGFYLILNYEDGIVYGFADVNRGIEGLKVDGTYYGSGGAATGAILRSTFNKNVRNTIILAEQDWGVYKIDNKDVTQEQFNMFMEENYTSKDDVTWIKFEKNTITETNSMTNQTANDIDGTYVYTRPMDGTENEGTTETIVLNKGNATYKDSYSGSERVGIYMLTDNKLVISYSQETSYNQSTGRDEVANIQWETEYEIEY